MPSKTFFSIISILQETLLAIGIGILILVPTVLLYFGESMPSSLPTLLFEISLTAVFLVMAIRPLADLLPKVPWIRPLVILRKGFGVLSASIIVAFMFSKAMIDAPSYFTEFFSASHWSLRNGAILSPLGDVSALILLITSNSFSKRVLKKNWKRIQKLAYLYFYAGALYEYVFFNQTFALVMAIVVTVLVSAAFFKKQFTGITSVLT